MSTTDASSEDGSDDSESETTSGPLSWLSVRWTRFSEWRAMRPFFGGILLVLGGSIIAEVLISSPMPLLSHSGRFVLALVAAIVVILCGIFALAKPERSGLLGIIGLIALVVSFVGLPFAAFVGVILSLLGGNFCYAWEDETDAEA